MAALNGTGGLIPIDFVNLTAGLGIFPPGSQALLGRSTAYLIAPFGLLVDESYTAYFNFTSF